MFVLFTIYELIFKIFLKGRKVLDVRAQGQTYKKYFFGNLISENKENYHEKFKKKNLSFEVAVKV